jgi:hypothetical protein
MRYRGLLSDIECGLCGKYPAHYWEGEKTADGWIECSVALCEQCFRKYKKEDRNWITMR